MYRAYLHIVKAQFFDSFCVPVKWNPVELFHGPVLINSLWQYFRICHYYLWFYFVFALVPWCCFLEPCWRFRCPVQETEDVPCHLVVVISQFCKGYKNCKYCVGRNTVPNLLHTWNIFSVYSTMVHLQYYSTLITEYCIDMQYCNTVMRVDFLLILILESLDDGRYCEPA